MTIESLRLLSNNQLNELVAKACGWKQGPCGCGFIWCDKRIRWFAPDNIWHSYIPDFSENLNAMHGLEAAMDSELSMTWMSNLSLAVHGVDDKDTVNMMQASARQRAEAYVLTMGKSD